MKKKIALLLMIGMVRLFFCGEMLKVNKNDSSAAEYSLEKVANITFSGYSEERLKVNKTDGAALYFDLSKIQDLTFSDLTGIEDNEEILTKLGISLLKNYPNPFNPETMIKFNILSEGMTLVEVYNHAGQLVTTLHKGSLKAGSHSLKWNAMENNATSGVYFVRVSQNSKQLSSKMLLVK